MLITGLALVVLTTLAVVLLLHSHNKISCLATLTTIGVFTCPATFSLAGLTLLKLITFDNIVPLQTLRTVSIALALLTVDTITSTTHLLRILDVKSILAGSTGVHRTVNAFRIRARLTCTVLKVKVVETFSASIQVVARGAIIDTASSALD